MADATTLERFLRRARRRAIIAVLVEQAVVAAGAAFAGFILLLFLGSRILDWYWVLILCVATFLYGLFRTLRRVPTPYKMAQAVDRRLALEDYISTAHYYSRPESNGRGSSEFREFVCERAGRLCEGIAVEAAAPIRVPRSAYATLALAVFATALFSVRYLTRRSLDFGPPLVPAIAEIFRPSWLVAKSRKEAPRDAQEVPPLAGRVIDPETGEAKAPTAGSEETKVVGQPREEYSSEAESMLDKMRDAFRDMLDKLGLADEADGTSESSSSEGKPGDKQTEKAGEKGSQSEETAAKDGAPRPDQEGDQAGEGDAKAMEAQKRTGQAEGQDPSEGEDGSGAGSSDGAKEIREAEQLAAMGKISEILGKRQVSLTGEMMVEVTSGDEQRLTTPYSATNAAHAEGGGEIHRDEVPLAYREYVQQYFEQVRKEAPAAASKQ